MKRTVSTLHVDNPLLFNPGTEDLRAVAVKVILAHGLLLSLPTQFL